MEVIKANPLDTRKPCPECGTWWTREGSDLPGGVYGNGRRQGKSERANFVPKTPSKGWIATRNGGRFWLRSGKLSDITLPDIAAALSKVCRFTGHCSRFYSVAEHSVYVSELVPPEHAFHALLHDASEAYLGDVSTPLKELLDDYRELEADVSKSIYARFGLPATLHPSIKSADYRVLATEVPILFDRVDPGWAAWLTGYKPVGPHIIDPDALGLSPSEAEEFFMMKVKKLWATHRQTLKRGKKRDDYRSTVRGRPLTDFQTLDV